VTFWGSVFEALVGGGVAGSILATIIGLLLKIWINRITAESDSLKERVADLEDNRLKKIEKDADERFRNMERSFKDHLSADQTGQIATELKHLNGAVAKVSDKVDSIASMTSGQDERIKANAHYIKNLDTSFQRHKEISHHG
jgi:methyl-accepting chemotaxis protein